MREFLDKAKENLKIAQLSLDNDCYNACANRAYFASFQAAIAALADKGIRSEKNEHAWVQSEFTLQLIKRKKVYPAVLKKYLPNMQIERNVADYSKNHISRKVALKQLSHAKEMIELIERELIK